MVLANSRCACMAVQATRGSSLVASHAARNVTIRASKWQQAILEDEAASREQTPASGPDGSRGSIPQAKKTDKCSTGFANIMSAFWSFTFEQKLSVVIGVVALLVLLPKIVLLGFVGVERALVGGIIAVESAVVAAAQYLVAGAAGVGIVGFVVLTLMSFLFPRKDK